MRTYSRRDIAPALRAVGLGPGQLVLVHSSLLHLGWLADAPAEAAPAIFYDSLREALGPEGTVIVPAFAFGFCRGQAFDPRETPSEGMGAFTEYVRRLPGSVRSPHPMQSVAANGPLAASLCSADTASSFDPQGPFAQLVQQDGWVLLLGAAIQDVSLVHLAEQQLEVPYRYWKSFTAKYRRTEGDREATYRMYVRDLKLDPQLKLAPIAEELRARGLLHSAALGAGRLTAFKARDFHEVTREGLQRDPWWLVENAKKREAASG